MSYTLIKQKNNPFIAPPLSRNFNFDGIPPTLSSFCILAAFQPDLSFQIFCKWLWVLMQLAKKLCQYISIHNLKRAVFEFSYLLEFRTLIPRTIRHIVIAEAFIQIYSSNMSKLGILYFYLNF